MKFLVIYVLGSFMKWIFLSLFIATEAPNTVGLVILSFIQQALGRPLCPKTFCAVWRGMSVQKGELFIFALFPLPKSLCATVPTISSYPGSKGWSIVPTTEYFFCSPAWQSLAYSSSFSSPYCLMWWLFMYSMCFIISYKLSPLRVGQKISLPWDVNCPMICLH